ncbi:hypothetical protein G6F68_021448 [Rhizopus microsporus]|nr:hypothetical protein G6F68_021448 [Rhizopus microsporus]
MAAGSGTEESLRYVSLIERKESNSTAYNAVNPAAVTWRITPTAKCVLPVPTPPHKMMPRPVLRTSANSLA